MGKLVAIKTYEEFGKLLLRDAIDNYALNYILDTKQLYTHGIFINGATFGTKTSDSILLTIAGSQESLALTSHTHSNYLEKDADIDIGSYKIKSGQKDLMYVSNNKLYIGGAPVYINDSTFKIVKNQTTYDILDTGNFSIEAKTLSGTTLQNVATFKYGGNNFSISYVRRINTTESFDNLISCTLAGTTKVNNIQYGFLTLYTDNTFNNPGWALLRFDIDNGTMQYRTSANSNNWISLNIPSLPVNALNTAGIVTAPTSSDGNKVWKTDSEGNPGWRSEQSYTFNDLKFLLIENTDLMTYNTLTTKIIRAGDNIAFSYNEGVLTLRAADTTYSLATDSTPGLVKVGTTLESDSSYTKVHIKDGFIYYHDTTYSFSDLKFLLTSGTDLFTYNSQSAKTILAGDNITFQLDSNNNLVIKSKVYSDFSGSGTNHKNGLVPDPGATQGTTKFLREDGTWEVPTYTQLPTFYNIIFNNGTDDVFTYDPDGSASKTIVKGSNINFEVSGNILTISAIDTWKPVNTTLSGYVPNIVTNGSLSADDNPFILVYKNVNNNTVPVWVPLPANAFNNTTYTFYDLVFNDGTNNVDTYKPTTTPSKTIKAGSNVTISAASDVITISSKDTWTAADFDHAGYVPKSVKGMFLHANATTGALEWIEDRYSANTDKTGIKLGTVNGTKKTDSTVIKTDSSTGLLIEGGTNLFKIGDGTNYIEIGVTPSITNNVTGSGTSGKLAKWNGTNTITDGPTLSAAITSLTQSTKFLREDGTWAAPSYTTDKTGVKKGTAGSTTTTDGTVISVNSSSGIIFEGGTNQFKVGNGTNSITIGVSHGLSTKNININGTDYAVYTSANSLPTIKAPTALGTSGQYLTTSDDGKSLTWRTLPTDNNTWRPIAVNGTEKRSSSISSGNLDIINGTNTTVEWTSGNKLKINAIDTWIAWKGATDSVNGTAGYMPAPTSAQRGQFLRGDGSWVSLNNYSLPTASSSTLGGVKTGAAITDTTGYTAVAIKDGVIYYKDTNNTYSAGYGLTLSSTTFSLGHRWQATTKGLIYSRIMYAESANGLVGCSGILTVLCTRNSVVVNSTFLITTSHDKYGLLILLSSNSYTATKLRIVVNNVGHFYIDIKDEARNIAEGTELTWYCTYIPISNQTVTTYTTFTSGASLPNGFESPSRIDTTIGDNTVAIKNITRSGTTFTATRLNGTTFTFDQLDNNTTYTLSTGDSNGLIKVTPSSGSAYNVSVKGLGDRAFDSTSYLPLTGGTLAANNSWLSPARLQLLRFDSSVYTDRACIGVTDGNLHIDSYPSHDIYLNYYSGNAIVHIGSYTALHSGNSSVSLSGSTLTVKINGTSQSLTNTTYSGNNGIGLSGTTFYNSGVRAITINDKYLRVNTNGTDADLTIPYATETTKLIPAGSLNVNSCSENLAMRLYLNLNNNNGYAGSTNSYGFPSSNNANGVLWMPVHNSSYGGLLGISSNLHLYYRYIAGGSFPTTANGGSWNRIAWYSEIPTKSSWNYNDMYVASVSISGNNLRINKNGSNSDLTIPYATNADTIDSYHEYSFLRYRGVTSTSGEGSLWSQIGIKQYNNGLPDSMNTASYTYGSCISLPGANSRLDIWYNHQSSLNSSSNGGIYYRSGWNDDKKGWVKLIDSGNIGSQSVNYATSAGNSDTVDGYDASNFRNTIKDYVYKDVTLANTNNWFYIGLFSNCAYFNELDIYVTGIDSSMHNTIHITYCNYAGWSFTKYIYCGETTNSTSLTKVGFWQSGGNAIKLYIYLKNTYSNTYKYTGYRIHMYYNSSSFTPVNPEVTSESNITQTYDLYYGSNIYANLNGNASTASSVAWSGVSSKPETATRWPSWSEVTSKPTTIVYTNVDQEISSIKTIKNSVGIRFPARSNNGTRASFYDYESWIHGGEDNASYLGCNLEIGTWYGFGIYPTISGQTRTLGLNSFWHNARTGDTYTWGDFYKFDGTNYIQACYVGTEQTISGVKNFNLATWKVKGEEYNDITNEYFSNSKLYNNRNTAVVSSNYSIKNAIKFTWYDTHWLIGNIRGGSDDTAGFGVALRDNTANNVHLIDCLRVNLNYTYLNGSVQTYIASTYSSIKLGYPGTDSFISALRFGGTSFGAADFFVGQDDHDLRLEGYNVRIRANEIDGLYVRKTGSVGIGNTNPSYKLHVSGEIGATAFNNTSDMRRKSVQEMWDIKDEDIANAPVFTFRWKDEEDQKLHLGTSALYWRDKAPELVSSNSEGILSLLYGVLGTINSIVLAKKLVKLRKEFENLLNSYDFEVKNLQGQINILQLLVNLLRNL